MGNENEKWHVKKHVLEQVSLVKKTFFKSVKKGFLSRTRGRPNSSLRSFALLSRIIEPT